jgi:hypothetical protein
MPAFYSTEWCCPLIGAPLTIPHGINNLRDYLTKRFPNEVDNLRHFLKQLELIQAALQIFTEKHGGLWWLAHSAELPYRLWSILHDWRSNLSVFLGRPRAIMVVDVCDWSGWLSE